MKTIARLALLFLVCSLASFKLSAQDEKEAQTFVEEMPEFPGGFAEMNRYISEHIKYPTLAQENGIEKKILIAFVVGHDGKLKDFEILGEQSEWGFEEEAIRVLKSMPLWTPGKQNGKAVNVKFTLPFTYKLERNRLFKKKKNR